MERKVTVIMFILLCTLVIQSCTGETIPSEEAISTTVVVQTNSLSSGNIPTSPEQMFHQCRSKHLIQSFGPYLSVTPR